MSDCDAVCLVSCCGYSKLYQEVYFGATVYSNPHEHLSVVIISIDRDEGIPLHQQTMTDMPGDGDSGRMMMDSSQRMDPNDHYRY